MRRLSAILLCVLLTPFGVASAQSRAEIGQAPGIAGADDASSLALTPMLSIWRAADGRLVSGAYLGTDVQSPWVLETTPDRLVDRMPHGPAVGGGDWVDVGVTTPGRVYSGVRVGGSQAPQTLPAACGALAAGCIYPQQSWRSGTLLGGYRGDSFLVDLGLEWLQHAPDAAGAYLLLPMREEGTLLGVPSQWVDSINRLEASGRLDLGSSGTHLDMGASIGRVRLAPDYLLQPQAARRLAGYDANIDSIDQKSISLGLGRGAVSGVLVGRMMRPDGPDQLVGSMRQPWSAVDLGITVRLPWEGELKLGAQNLWSSGDAGNLPTQEPDPVRDRIPYIRYHQNL